jgi:hypothetical protein
VYADSINAGINVEIRPLLKTPSRGTGGCPAARKEIPEKTAPFRYGEATDFDCRWVERTSFRAGESSAFQHCFANHTAQRVKFAAWIESKMLVKPRNS